MRAALLLSLPFAGLVALAGPALAEETPTPSPSATVTTAGTSFLTATKVEADQPVRVSGSTGDYQYWSYEAAAGETDRLAITITLPPGSSRHGPATWTVDVFDGLRRRQACTAGSQTSTAATGTGTVALHCLLRQVRSWADPWSDEPLPGTYYVRLSATGLPEQDLGLPIQTDVTLDAHGGDAQPDNAKLKAPLSPKVDPGATVAPQAAPSASPEAGPLQRAKGWFSWPSGRWWWTIGGGVLAAMTGVGGYSLTRHPRRWFR
ncbi:hypothetical protein [Actinomadura sp. DC4]|uniref:hypothetical protein n=1 Tax=Actinomadura sp. DC4 TaxID=3055069 RepID=UPI0025AFCBC8|nr:hypothetical protein [Actinomadura sp. DC4]MDN3354119.1 hypothetical protein [Actinomadura sp. DC4]